jgi:DNA replication initiation complex subunit (GINS family)
MAGLPKIDYITAEQIESLIIELRGNLGQVANRLEMSRTWVQSRVDKDSHLQEVLADARESMLDNAESKLYSNVLNGMETSLIFFLKTQGYKRGYGRQGNYDPDQAESTDRPATVADIDRAIARLANSERGAG